jgi:hypothetical protein
VGHAEGFHAAKQMGFYGALRAPTFLSIRFSWDVHLFDMAQQLL